MRPALLAQLGLGDRLGDVVGASLLARAAAIRTRRAEGPSRRMQDLAALSIGTMAVLDADVTRRAAAGLARTLAGTPSELSSVAEGIAVAAGGPPSRRAPFLPDLETPGAAPLGWVVFSFLSIVVATWEHEAGLYWPDLYPEGILSVIGRDDGQPIGRLGISAYRWMRLATSSPGAERAAAARWILDRAAEEVERAMRDSFHWQNLHAGLAPVEPELLLAGLIFLREASRETELLETTIRPSGRPAVDAAVAAAADMLGQERIAAALGGPTGESRDEAWDRWREWLNATEDGPLTW